MKKNANKKHICMIMTDAVSFNGLCKGQLEYFVEKGGVSITAVCGGSSEAIAVLENRNIGDVKVIPMRRQPAAFSDFICLLQLIVYFAVNRFDTVVYSTPKASLLAAIATKLTGQKRRLFLIRGRAYENKKGIKRWLYQRLDNLILRCSHQTIAISHSLKAQYITDKACKAQDIKVLGNGSSNGVDTKRFHPNKKQLNPDYFTIVSVGRLCHDKGILDLLEVVKYFNTTELPVRFLIAGGVDDDTGAYAYEQLNQYDNVQLLNKVADPSRVFAQADLHLFLSHREGFGNVAIEAAASGVPTLAYDVVGVQG